MLFRFLLSILVLLFTFGHYFVFPNLSYTLKVNVVKYFGFEFSGYKYSSYHLRQAFIKEYGKSILQEEEWVPANTGGLQGSVSILYASLTELLVLYHAESETFGNSGRHYMNVSVTVLQGRMTLSSNDLAEVFAEGERKVLRMGESSMVRLNAKTKLLIYSRGFIPLTMGYWLSDSIFSYHDPILVFSTLGYFIKALFLSNTILQGGFQGIFGFLSEVSQNGVGYILQSIQGAFSAIHHLASQLHANLYHFLVTVKERLTSLLM